MASQDTWTKKDLTGIEELSRPEIELLFRQADQFLPALVGLFGIEISTAGVSHAELMIFGALIVWFLIVEPHGLAKLWSTAKQKLRLWPFPH